MQDLAGLPTIVDAPDQPLAKHQPLIAHLRRNPAAIRTAVLLVEPGRVTGASLLPIDPNRIAYGNPPGSADRAASEERIRSVNAMVARSTPAAAVGRYLDGLYTGKVATHGATSVVGYVPSGWSAQADPYRAVFGPDCMMCHLAAPAALNFESFGQLAQSKAAVYGTVCQQHTMPNAQVPYRHFWSATQPLANTTLNLGGYLMASLGFTGCP